MPVRIKEQTSRVRLQFVDSRDEEGKEKLSSTSYSNIKPEASDEAVFNLTTQLIGLQEKEVKTIVRVVEKELVEE
ncbi:DUF1659 domain-containing protein [Clostridium formicaceticum]|uniref:DUF1659 domain-containing protein n=1 Tax=Clostridium formicaceticum TaxID=1497 RepID=A0AAC9WES5_9CLOT|nr:DUF1659 domain-containing protein [Clostridium formicaceticum]AOY75635.1 hypothetical protein BJL90_06850 [Clostridium formicaceticum]ARE85948.1 hypothetical protein CLFO_02640 [Clostridium formicaceticum]